MALTAREIQDAYVTFFNRAADTEGFAYWTSYPGSISDLYATFAQQTEYTSVYGGKTAEQQITTVYQNLFNRAPDAEGLAYWKPLVETGAITLANLALTVNRGAQGDDVTALDTKITSAITETAEAIAANAPGNVINLTSGADAKIGTDNADTFVGKLLTVNSTDDLNGGLGNDKASLELNADLASTFKMASVEEVTVTGYGARAIDMTNVSGVDTLIAYESTGNITLNNVTDAKMALGFKGAGTNNVTANYKAGALDGAADTVKVVLNSAKAVSVNVDPGFESATVEVSGASDIDGYTVPGVETLVITGSGSLDFADTTADGIKTITATGFSGAVTTGTVSATTGYVGADIVGNSAGSSVLLGSGNDNIGFTGATTASTGSNTVKLGAGDDRAVVNVAGSGSTYVFGEAGNDTVRVTGTALAVDDLVDLGAGDDTLNVDVAASTLILRGVENLTLTKAATSATIGSADGALSVTQTVGNTAVDLNDLTDGSTVTVQGGASEATKTATNVAVGYKNAQEAATVNITNGMTGILETSKITNATVNLGAASNIGSAYSFIDATSVTLNATGALSATTGQNVVDGTATDVLKSFTATGSDAVKFGTITSTALEGVSVTAAKDLSTGAIGTDSTKLTSVNLASTAGSITVGTGIGKSDNTGVLSVTAAGKNAVDVGAIISTKVGDVNLTSSAGAATIGALGANATAIGDVTVVANGNVTVDLIGNTSPAATAVGTISLTSTTGLVDVSDMDVKDAGGITLNLNAKTLIADGTSGTDKIAVENTGGNITANVGGAAAAYLSLINLTSGVSTLNASNTGGGAFLMTNAGTAGDGETSSATLGNAASGKTNALTVGGTVDTLNITGGSGNDVVDFSSSTSAIKGGTIALAGGSGDSLNFTNFALASPSEFTGVAANFGSSSVNVTNGTNTTALAAGKLVGYDTDAASNTSKLSTTLNFTVSGVEKFEGSANADYIVASNTGMEITGGAGSDAITLGAGADTVVFDAIASNGADTIASFLAGSGGDVLNFGTILGTGGTVLGGSSATIVAGTAASNSAYNVDQKVGIYKGAALSAVDTAAEVAALFGGASNSGYFWMSSGATASSVILTGADDSTTVYAWGVINAATDGVASGEVTLIGTLTLTTGDIDGLVAGNFVAG